MFPRPTLHTLLLTLLCVMLLVTRVGQAHLHLCFDGAEPPVSLHIGDIDMHQGADMSGQHDDIDLSLGTQISTKLGKLPVALMAVLAILLWPSSWPLRFARYSPVVRRHLPPFLRPPVRGPPLPFSL